METSAPLQHVDTGKHVGKLYFRAKDDDEYEDWWFAGTAIPLVAATVGPLANVLSIGALVTFWRMNLMPDNAPIDTYVAGQTQLVQELEGYPFEDPTWCYDINVLSLVFGFVGNFFLLANFTNRIRYIVALPATILCWYIATAMLIGITVSMNIHVPPVRPQETYTQGFWYGVIAAVLYMLCAMMLMVNMVGYFLGHYTQHFNLSDAQRTLILQTMLFFMWLAGGAGVFAKVETEYGNQHWLFTDALYFCDVTVLTVGFGDLYPHDDIGRGLVFPYSVGGIIFLGLMIGSITRFAKEISQEEIVRKRVNSQRVRTLERTNTVPDIEALRKRNVPFPMERQQANGPPANPTPVRSTTIRILQNTGQFMNHAIGQVPGSKGHNRRRSMTIMQEEKERFDMMRRIQKSTQSFKNYTALTISIFAFGILWCIGALVFYYTEKHTQGLSYFEALYFCYVSLLTIGYGDLAPKSNAGRPFFVVWSILAVPSMTILVSDLGDTVIARFKNATSKVADFTVLPQYGVWRNLLNKYPSVAGWVQRRIERQQEKRRMTEGFPVGPDDDDETPPNIRLSTAPTIDKLATSEPESAHDLARKLALKIRTVIFDLKNTPKKKYAYEEWVEFTDLIRFTRRRRHSEHLHVFEEDDEDEGLIEWDWIGEDSPMMAHQTEPEFVLERLCESMARYLKRQGETKDSPSPENLSTHAVTSLGSSMKNNGDEGMTTIEEHDNEDIGPLDDVEEVEQYEKHGVHEQDHADLQEKKDS